MKKTPKISFSFLIMLLPFLAPAQEVDPAKSYEFTLEEAVNFGLEHNYASQVAAKDIAIALKQKWEIIAQGLPQIAANVDYQNYLKQPVTLIPAEISGGPPGTYTPVQFGTKQNLNATATWNQLIFDGSYIVGIQSARTLLQISKNAKLKTDLQVRQSIINAYGNVLLAQETVEILQKNIATAQKNYDDTSKIFESGFAEEEDVERLEITLLTLQNNLNRSVRMYSIAKEMLNFVLGIPVEAEVKLLDDLDSLTQEFYDPFILEEDVAVEENIDYIIAANNAEAAAIRVKLEKSKALPSITGFLNYGFQGNNEEFNFLEEDQQYFSQSILGVSLHIPIFSSGLRSARTQQKKIAYEQALINLEETANDVKLQINSAKTEYAYSLENYETLKRRVALAERIESKNSIKFFEGLASSFELSEAQAQLYAAQQDLLQAMLQVITAKVDLENLLYTNQ